ncbi:hypothetical protein B0H14DRAFT_2593459 [Mycena olivaceomarginata]|nr:hypothetical protein B0H14DRAFT_2593459 [Mycena olivaceomarginata]
MDIAEPSTYGSAGAMDGDKGVLAQLKSVLRGTQPQTDLYKIKGYRSLNPRPPLFRWPQLGAPLPQLSSSTIIYRGRNRRRKRVSEVLDNLDENYPSPPLVNFAAALNFTRRRLSDASDTAAHGSVARTTFMTPIHVRREKTQPLREEIHATAPPRILGEAGLMVVGVHLQLVTKSEVEGQGTTTKERDAAGGGGGENRRWLRKVTQLRGREPQTAYECDAAHGEPQTAENAAQRCMEGL